MSIFQIMNRSVQLALVSTVVMFFAFFILDYRLYVTYIDYRNATYLHCLHCGALGCKHETMYLFGNCKPPHQNPWTLMHKIPFRNLYSIEQVYVPNGRCNHEWEASLTQVKQKVCSDHFFYSIPQKLYDDYETADRVLMCVVWPALLCVLGVLFRNHKSVVCILNVFGVIFASGSFAALAYCARVHLGTPVTDLLGDFRNTRQEVMRHEMVKDRLARVVYLLSEKPIVECVRRSGYVEPHDRKDLKSGVPIRMFIKEQSRLASTIAQYDVALAECYFYGRSLQTPESFETLVLSMNNHCRINKDRKEREGLVISGMMTNAFGLVTVVWGDESRSSLNTYSETTFQRIKYGGDKGRTDHWVPVRNIDGMKVTYSDCMYFQNSW